MTPLEAFGWSFVMLLSAILVVMTSALFTVVVVCIFTLLGWWTSLVVLFLGVNTYLFYKYVD